MKLTNPMIPRYFTTHQTTYFFLIGLTLGALVAEITHYVLKLLNTSFISVVSFPDPNSLLAWWFITGDSDRVPRRCSCSVQWRPLVDHTDRCSRRRLDFGSVGVSALEGECGPRTFSCHPFWKHGRRLRKNI